MTADDLTEFHEGLRLFNAQEFFACHDVLEEIWTGTLGAEREFYQGLIHAAVSLFHFGEGNLGGARKMYSSGVKYLKQYAPHCMGVDLDRFLDDFRACFAELLAVTEGYPSHVVLHSERIPTIFLIRD